MRITQSWRRNSTISLTARAGVHLSHPAQPLMLEDRHLATEFDQIIEQLLVGPRLQWLVTQFCPD